MLVEVELERHERGSLGAELAVQVINLLAVQKQAALAVRVDVPHAPVGVRMDVDAVQPALPAADEAERVGDLARALAQALDLGARELDARLEGLVNEVLVARGAVAGDGLLLGLRLLGGLGGLGHVSCLPLPRPRRRRRRPTRRRTPRPRPPGWRAEATSPPARPRGRERAGCRRSRRPSGRRGRRWTRR